MQKMYIDLTKLPDNLRRMLENNEQLKSKKGPYYEKWRVEWERVIGNGRKRVFPVKEGG